MEISWSYNYTEIIWEWQSAADSVSNLDLHILYQRYWA